MSESVSALIDRLRPTVSFDADEEATEMSPVAREVATALTESKPFVLERKNDGHVFLTTPAAVREMAGAGAPFFMKVTGKYVEANVPNSNGAMWTSQGLEVGLPTVVDGPLNWLHEEKRIVGCITDADLVKSDKEKASFGVDDHIAIEGVVWSWLWPREAASVNSASQRNSLYLSMECVSDSVTCVDGCGQTFGHEQAMLGADGVCEHIRRRTGIRRFNNPVFLGGAVVVPPHRPGWSNSSAKVEMASEMDPGLDLAVNDVLMYSGARR